MAYDAVAPMGATFQRESTPKNTAAAFWAKAWRADRDEKIRAYLGATTGYNRARWRRDALHYGRLARKMEAAQ